MCGGARCPRSAPVSAAISVSGSPTASQGFHSSPAGTRPRLYTASLSDLCTHYTKDRDVHCLLTIKENTCLQDPLLVRVRDHVVSRAMKPVPKYGFRNVNLFLHSACPSSCAPHPPPKLLDAPTSHPCPCCWTASHTCSSECQFRSSLKTLGHNSGTSALARYSRVCRPRASPI